MMNKAERLIQIIEEKDTALEPEGAGYQARLEIEDVLKQVGLKGKMGFYTPKAVKKSGVYPASLDAEITNKNRPGSISYDPERNWFYFSAPYYWGKGWSHDAPDFGTNDNPGGTKEDLIKFLIDFKAGRL